jgi:hypothetical protein
MAQKADVKLFGYYPEAGCGDCLNFNMCGGQAHRGDDGTAKALRDAYGERVQVSLINVFSSEMKGYPEVMECIRKNGLRVPIVMVNGEIKLMGSEATIEAIKASIESQLKKGLLSFLAGRT